MAGLANQWPALKSWKSDEGGSEYLNGLFGDEKVSVFTNTANNNPKIASRAYSFRSDYKK